MQKSLASGSHSSTPHKSPQELFTSNGSLSPIHNSNSLTQRITPIKTPVIRYPLIRVIGNSSSESLVKSSTGESYNHSLSIAAETILDSDCCPKNIDLVSEDTTDENSSTTSYSATATEIIPSGDLLKSLKIADSAKNLPAGSKMSDPILTNLDEMDHEIEFSYRNFPSKDLDEVALTPDYLETLASLNMLVKGFSKSVRSLSSLGPNDALSPGDLQTWKDKLEKHETDLGQYRREVRRRIADLNGATNLNTPVNTGSLPAGNIEDNGSTHSLGSLNPDNRAAKERKVALATSKGKLTLINQDLEYLNAEYTKHLDWSEAEDAEVEKAMKNLSKWKETLHKIRKDTVELEAKIEGEGLDELVTEFARLKTKVSTSKSELETAISSIEDADVDKGLYSDRKTKSTPLQFPQFSGNPSEDLVEFQTKFEKALVANRIPKCDQLDKLKEVLKGKAKTQVPVKTDTLERAWDLLESAFGDPMTLLKYRKQAISKLGPYPDNLTKTNPQKVVDWCLEIERLIDDLVKLGDRNARLERVAFNDDTLNEVIDLFPIRVVFEMERLDDDGRDKLVAIQEIVERERQILQRMAVRSVKRQHKPTSQESPIPPSKIHSIQPKGLSMFNNPRKLPNCRVCKELEKRGDNHDLYESHQGNYATHCPRWAALSNEERSDVAKAAKLCLICLDPKVTYNSSSTSKHKCITTATKNRFSCTVERCLFHSWVCTRHKSENKELLEKFKIELQKRSMVFSYILSFNISENPDADPPPPVSSCPSKERKMVNKPQDLNVPETIDKLKRLTPKGDILVTKLKDPPLFMFSSTPGRYSDVQIFYDTGNSHVLFKSGTPENLYGTKTRNGPFPLGAVGDTTIYSEDEWACQPMTSKGHREILIGLCVPKITSSFPRVSLKEATAELKASAPENKEVQELRVPDYVGGECHILLGIQYQAHFPRLVHSLESGLGIYAVKLQPSSPYCTAAIAGPHHSFNLLSGKVGNVSYLLQKFKEGIDYWKQFGAPAPKSLAMSEEELKLAHSINKMDIANITNLDIDDLEEASEVTIDQHIGFSIETECKNLKENSRLRIATDTVDNFLDGNDSVALNHDVDENVYDEPHTPSCNNCFSALFNKASSNTSSGEPLCNHIQDTEISTANFTQDSFNEPTSSKQFVASEEAPLKIEYRCPRCRNCVQCRDAVETEKISLREEAEDAEIRDSVKLDFKNKRFICKLPLRGNVSEFLSTNKHSAEKVLEKQCQLYNKETEVKDLILKAMDKLFSRGHIKLLNDLPKEQQDLILKEPTKYFIPWRIAFKPGSLSTPARPVFDCSSKTPRRADNSGGRCLNDLMCKGRSMSLNLIKMLLKFLIGTHALSSDLRQFYNCFKLIPEHWHLQLFLWKAEMNPDAETVIAVIMTLIYGNKASAPQSEEGMRQFSEYLRKIGKVDLADFLLNDRFVDDLNTSKPSKAACDYLQEQTDLELGTLGVETKGWGRTGERPSDEIAEDGCMGVAGMIWCPEIDSIEVRISKLHFGSVSRGRLAPGTEIFKGDFGTFEEMNNFVPKSLTKRMLASKFYGIYDPLGKLIPLTSKMKMDMSRILKGGMAWDDVVADEHRTSWVKHFLSLEKAKGLKFSRPRMPIDAVDTKMRLFVLVDATSQMLVIWSGVGFKRKNGSWSIAYLIGRCLLAPAGTIPRNEMEVLVAGSNMLWLLRQILSNWVDQFLLAGDAQIPLFWTLSDKKRLGLWHRTRSVQIRRGTPLENLYHVRTEMNIADGPTRPDKLGIDDIGPGSTWETGLPWMTRDLDEIVADGILTPVQDLVMKKEDQKEYDDGFVLEKTPDILTQGHFSAVSVPIKPNKRVELVSTRAAFSKYMILPTKFSYDKGVRIQALALKWIHKFRLKWQPGYDSEVAKEGLKHQVFHTPPSGDVNIDNRSDLPLSFHFSALASYYNKEDLSCLRVRILDEDLQRALQYSYRKATKEAENFVKSETLAKIAVKKDGILYHKSRILDGQRFLQTGGFEGMDILRSQGINALTPVIDRWSPLAYSIGDYIHNKIAKHKGSETCFRTSHSFVHILKGLSLFQELASDCVTCLKLNHQFIEAAMGPIHKSKFTLAPPFWTCQVDLWGPVTTFVPGREKNTRNSNSLDSKVWAMVFACCVTKLVNIQVIETKDSSGICDGLTRLTCEVGTPAHLLIDQESSLMKCLKEGNIDIVDLEGNVRQKVNIGFSICPVSGHNVHGLVEAKIKVAQRGLNVSGAGSSRLHATGFQTLCKMIENDMNNTPVGLTSGRTESNSPLLKLLSPNMMRLGRINSRNPIGPFKLPSGPKSMLDRVQDCYKLWYREYEDTLLMKYLLDLQPKWFKSSRDTKIGDVVYFRKTEGKLEGKWQLGCVDDLERSSDGIIRSITILYHNASENTSRTTIRAVRSVVKLFNVEEGSWKEDMDKVKAILENHNIPIIHEASATAPTTATSPSPEDTEDLPDDGNISFDTTDLSASFSKTIAVQPSDAISSDASGSLSAASKTPSGENVSYDTKNLLDYSAKVDDEITDYFDANGNLTCDCCCVSHHLLTLHGRAKWTTPTIMLDEAGVKPAEIEEDEMKPFLDVASHQAISFANNDAFLSQTVALQTDFNLEPRNFFP